MSLPLLGALSSSLLLPQVASSPGCAVLAPSALALLGWSESLPTPLSSRHGWLVAPCLCQRVAPCPPSALICPGFSVSGNEVRATFLASASLSWGLVEHSGQARWNFQNCSFELVIRSRMCEKMDLFISSLGSRAGGLVRTRTLLSVIALPGKSTFPNLG